MSSEMRELMQSVLDFVNRQPCRCMSIAQLGERDYCDRCQSVKNLRALLARTEAGAPHHPLAICPTCKDYYEVCECTPDAAPVADGAVAWSVEWDEDNDGDAFYVTLDTERGAMRRANEAIAEGFKGVRIRRLVYGDTHPQDASGDAERYRVLRRALADPMFTSDALADAISGRNAKAIDAVVDAMQAKEAK